ncbi:MAG TPA: elongation factor G [Thermodesulfobium narugense]|nr:MAG: elongation factor G [Thermodesulfobium narugense]HEM55195.1 elongation factor G [Thermodesulfobium narugense]
MGKTIKTISLVSHVGAGKTSLTEALLFYAKKISRLGSVDSGNTVTDYDVEEIKRKMTLSLSVVNFEEEGTKYNIIDTPGFFDFESDVIAAESVSEGLVLLLNATSTLEVGIEKILKRLKANPKPFMVVVNKMDKEGADFFNAVNELRLKSLGFNIACMYLPFGNAGEFKGMVHVMSKKSIVFDGDFKFHIEESFPEELETKIEEEQERLKEAAAEGDDTILEKYLAGEDLSEEEIVSSLKNAVKLGKTALVIPVSSVKGYGIAQLVRAFGYYFPDYSEKENLEMYSEKEMKVFPINSDFELIIQIFKTVLDPFVGKVSFAKILSGSYKGESVLYNVTKQQEERIASVSFPFGKEPVITKEVDCGDIVTFSKLQITTTNDTLSRSKIKYEPKKIEFPKPTFFMGVYPKVKGDEDKLGSAIIKFIEEDPSMFYGKSPETGEFLLGGLGDIQMDVLMEKVKRRFKVEGTLVKPKVAYRESIKIPVVAEGKHKKQTGGHGQYGHVIIKFEPIGYEEEFIFESQIVGGVVPKQYVPAVEKGLREVLGSGHLAGYPVIGIKAILVDGSYHEVDSNELSFKMAAHLAFKKAMEKAKPVLLEPINYIEVTVPKDFTGDVMGDLNSKRGRIQGMDSIKDSETVIKAYVPQSEIVNYAMDLRSITQGRGSFVTRFDHFEEAPPQIAEKVIKEASVESSK